jgi:hypothetical protein
MKRQLVVAVAVTVASWGGTWVHGQESPPSPPVDCAELEQDLFADLKEVVRAGCTPSEAQIARLLDNPVGNFVAFPIQFDAIQFEGPRIDHTETLYRLQFIPTFPLKLGPDWNLINRVVLPAMSVPINEGFGDCIGFAPDSITTCPSFPDALADPFKPTRGFGDVVYMGLASPKELHKVPSTGAAVIWGAGATTLFPTASDEILGSGKYAVGPAAAAGYLGTKWLFGILAQHWWSVAGSSEREDLSLTNLQYFLFYVPPWNEAAQWRIGMTPNITYNWRAQGDKATVPVGLGIGRMTQVGQLPVQVFLEVDYSIIRPDDKPGSRWGIRLYFTPVIPTFMF